MEVAVVGGGIIGVASAYYLADRGVDVTVFDKGTPGNGSTGRANGGIRAQFTSAVSVALSLESMDVWQRFDDLFGMDIEYRRTGYLFLARTAETAARFREHVSLQNDLGVPSERLSPEGAGEHCPGLSIDRYEAAMYSPTDGFADPHLAHQAFISGAREAGASIQANVGVTDIHLSDGRISTIETTDGDHDVEYVVNAAGPWAGRVASMVDHDLPVSPRRRQLLVAQPDPPVTDDLPMTVDMDENVHFRPERDGAAILGGHFAASDPEQDPDNYTKSNDSEWIVRTLEQAADVASYFGPETKVVRGWAGLYTVTPDHHPIIEETRPGFINAVGFSGHGFMQSPATGQVVSELIVDGDAKTVDVTALTADRFERGETLHEGTVID